MPSDRRLLRGGLSVLACLVACVLAATAAHADDQVPVPDVRGLTEAQARATLARAGLTVAGVETVAATQVGSGYRPGTVYQQAPPPSSQTLPSWLPRGGRVYLRVVASTRTAAPTPTPPGPGAPTSTAPQPTPPMPTAPPTPAAPQPTAPMPTPPQPTGPTPRSYPGGVRPPPPPAPPGMGPSTTPPYVAPGPTTIPMPTQPMPTQPLGTPPPGGYDARDIAGFVEVPSEPASPPGAAGLRTRVTQYALPCERLRDTWTILGKAGWAFTAGSDSGDSSWYAGFDVTRWFDGCFGVGLYYRFSAQSFDRLVTGGTLEDAGGFHHLGLKLSYQSTFRRGGPWFWWAGLGIGWFASTGYQRNHEAFEGYGEAGIGYLFARRSRLRLGVDMLVTDTKAGRYDPSRDGNSRLLWWFAPSLSIEYDF